MKIIEMIKSKTAAYFPALESENFGFFWISQCVSVIGSWIQSVGQSWLVFSLTKSPFLLGIIGALQYIPVLLFSVFAGVFIDKTSKKTILILTQTAYILLSLLLALLVWTGYIRIWHIISAGILQGFINTLDMPARQAIVSELVEREHVLSAIALNSSVFNAARIIGPALAGILMGYFGIAACFLINAFGFILALLLTVKIQPETVRKDILQTSSPSFFSDMRMGLAYLSENKMLYKILLLVAVMGIFALNFNVLIPVLSSDVFHQDEAGFGFLMSAMGIGSFAGAIFLAAKGRAVTGITPLVILPFIMSLLLALTAFVTNYSMMIMLLALSGLVNTMFFTSANSSLQLMTLDEYRGRITSLYTLVYGGTAPIGNFFVGWITEGYGIQSGFLWSGILNLIFVIPIVLMRSGKEFSH
ncbi:MAG: MFS transporter [Clostridia bacterium]|nr:MFS transporter [Clostridia bacterium]